MSVVILILGMLSIQYGASLAKALFDEIGPLLVTLLRVDFAAMMLTLYSQPWKNKELFYKYLKNKKILKFIFLYGCALGLMNLFFYKALQFIPLGIAVAIEFMGPLVVALFYSRQKKDLIWVGLVILGLYFILPERTKSLQLQTSDFQGYLLAFLAALMWGFYIIIGKKMTQEIPENHMRSSLGVISAGVVVTIIILSLEFNQLPKIMNFSILGSSLVMALLASAIPYSLEFKALQMMDEFTFGLFMSLEPLIATFIGYVFLKEVLTLEQIIAILLIVTSCAGHSYFSFKQKKRAL